MAKGQLRAALFAVLSLPAAPAWAAAPPPLDSYGDLPGIEQVSISPSGRNKAIVGRVQGERRLVVLDGEHKLLATAPAGEAKIRDLSWIGEDAVLLTTSVTQTLDPIFTADKAELFGGLVVPADGSKPWMVFEKSQNLAKTIRGDYGKRFIDGKWQGFFGGIQYAQSNFREEIIGSTDGLFAVDFKTNSTRRVAQISASGYRRDWLVDANGRAAASFDISVTTGKWEVANEQGRVLASGTNSNGGVGLVCFGKDGSSAIYWAEDEKAGEAHYYEVPLAGGTPNEILAGVSVDHLYIDATNSRMLGYLENGNPPVPHFFDAAQQAVVHKVQRAFPKLHVELEQWTPDFGHLLVRTSGNGDSGSWYVVDMTRLRAETVGSERPLVVPDEVGPISIVNYRAADGLALDGILTLPPGREAKNLPLIMLPHGGPAGHDEAEFDWWAQAFASRGYAVFQPNFRGSTNRDYAFEQAGHGQWGRKMQSDISDGLAELARQGIVDPKRACIMGASYGGYAALAGVTLQHGLYRCAVAVAPVSDLQELYAKRNYISGDAKMTWRAQQESLGPPAGFDEVSPRRHADAADAPILLVHGKDDTVVPFHQSEAMASALERAGKPHEMVVLREEDHWLSHAATRKQMLEAAMRFVEQHNPAN